MSVSPTESEELALGRLAVDGGHRAVAPNPWGRAVIPVLPGKHHLEHRAAAEVPRHFQVIDQLFERQVLVRVGPQGRLADAVQEIHEPRIAREIAGHHQGIDEQADEAFDLGPVPAGDGSADADAV